MEMLLPKLLAHGMPAEFLQNHGLTQSFEQHPAEPLYFHMWLTARAGV
jgi:hypothetical protein